MLGFLKDSPAVERYQELADRISERSGFMKACGIDAETIPSCADRFLHQPRGAAARLRAGLDPRRFHLRRLVRTSGHMLWIGDRTRQPDHAHVEFCRGIKNPIGLKCGPSLKPDGLLEADRHRSTRTTSRAA
jgi:3-deoxy-7-phosphoheptulonate synthase